MPTFTNPNNASIVTGVPPAVHGISGNYYLDRATGEERMITDASLMRCGTILAAHGGRGREDGGRHRQGQAAADAGARARGHQLLLRARRPRDAGRRTASATSRRWSGRPKPDQYSGDLSLYVLDAGLRLLERKAATLLYLSLSDFIQHAHAPGTPEADAFNRAVDERIARMVAAGAIVGVVADHGMNDKSRADGAAQRRVPAGGAEQALRRRRGARHLPDHRSRSCAITGRWARSCASTRARRRTSRR